MPKFRNLETGKVFTIGERWAGKLRTQPHLVELTPEGADIPSEPQAVTETDPALKRLRLADLQALCADAGLPADGTKAALIARLGDIQPDAAGERVLPPNPGGPDTSEE